MNTDPKGTDMTRDIHETAGNAAMAAGHYREAAAQYGRAADAYCMSYDRTSGDRDTARAILVRVNACYSKRAAAVRCASDREARAYRARLLRGDI
jgi:hypothetical protein